MAVDLNEIRAARREGKKKGPEVKFGRRTFVLPVELPFEAVQYIIEMSGIDTESDEGKTVTPKLMLGIARGLLGDKDFDLFMRERPSTEDLAALVEGVLKEYGLDAPESSGSEA